MKNKIELKYQNGVNINVKNIVWNRVYNYYSYSSSNLLIIQYLSGKQKVVTFNEEICCLLQSEDEQKLYLGVNKDIYIVDCQYFNIIKVLHYHGHPIQRLAVYHKYLISVGNHKECSVAVWDISNEYTILANSYTIDRINDVQIYSHHPTNNNCSSGDRSL